MIKMINSCSRFVAVNGSFAANIKLSSFLKTVVNLLLLMMMMANSLDAAPPVTVSPAGDETIRFRSSTLQGRVEEALSKAKENDLSYMMYIMRIYKGNTDKVFDEVQKYTSSEDDDVKFAIVIAASTVRTGKSLQVLVRLVSDEEVGHQASQVIYDNYRYEEIVPLGGSGLKRALLRNFIANRYSTHTTLLLSCFRDKKIVEIMSRRKRSYSSAKRKTDVESLLIDVALSNMGLSDALRRVDTVFFKKETDNILTVLLYVKYVNSKVVLDRVVNLLKDKRKARTTGFSHGPSTYTRLCDEALVALRSRFDASVPPYYGPPRRFDDVELAAAYKKYKARIAAKK